MTRRFKRFTAVAAMTAGLTLLAAAPAFASDEPISGQVNHGDTALIVGSKIRTVATNGTQIKLRYDNGIGATNNVALRIGPLSVRTGEQFADTTVMGPSTGGNYTLATDVLARTQFKLQWRPSEPVYVDNDWSGHLWW